MWTNLYMTHIILLNTAKTRLPKDLLNIKSPFTVSVFMRARPQSKIFQKQIFIKHYAPYIETHYDSTWLWEVQKEIYCPCPHAHLSMEVHWFAVSKLQVRGQLCYPGHVVSFYQVLTRLSIWSLVKEMLTKQHLCLVDWIPKPQHCLCTDFFSSFLLSPICSMKKTKNLML